MLLLDAAAECRVPCWLWREDALVEDLCEEWACCDLAVVTVVGAAECTDSGEGGAGRAKNALVWLGADALDLVLVDAAQ